MQTIILRSACRSLLLLRFSHTAVSSCTSSVVLLQKTSVYTVPSCLLRTRSSGHSENKEKSETAEDKTDAGEGEKGERHQENTENQAKQINPAIARKLRIYVLIVGGLSFVTSFFLLARIFKEGSGLPAGASTEHFNKPGIEFNVFVQRYLKAGEVRNIIFCPQAYKAVAYLHEGAVIDGQREREQFVVVSYTGNAQQFWADIRKEEALIGISLTNGVPIQLYQGMSGWRLVELLIGVAIIGFLGTQYGRLLRQRVLANKAKTGPGGTPPGGSTPKE